LQTEAKEREATADEEKSKAQAEQQRIEFVQKQLYSKYHSGGELGKHLDKLQTETKEREAKADEVKSKAQAEQQRIEFVRKQLQEIESHFKDEAASKPESLNEMEGDTLLHKLSKGVEGDSSCDSSSYSSSSDDESTHIDQVATRKVHDRERSRSPPRSMSSTTPMPGKTPYPEVPANRKVEAAGMGLVGCIHRATLEKSHQSEQKYPVLPTDESTGVGEEHRSE
jgi:hypothetical protein